MLWLLFNMLIWLGVFSDKQVFIGWSAIRALGFGSTAAVHAWHRIGAFLSEVVRRLAKAPLARYVDDNFGAGECGVHRTGGRALTFFASLAGIRDDPAKAAYDELSMVILGKGFLRRLTMRAVRSNIPSCYGESHYMAAAMPTSASGTSTTPRRRIYIGRQAAFCCHRGRG